MTVNICCVFAENDIFTERDRLLMRCVSEKRREKIKRYRYDIDRKLSLYAELLCAVQLRQLRGDAELPVDICPGKYGKPHFSHDYGLHFNWSHTRKCVICASSSEGMVGADVEKNDTPPFDVMELAFHKDEIAYVDASESGQQRCSRFFEVWTRKEAYGKYTGEGLSETMTGVNLLDDDRAEKLHTWEYGGYIFSVCLAERYEKIDIEYMNETGFTELGLRIAESIK